jgi:membrane-associated phospholipid phosphatase
MTGRPSTLQDIYDKFGEAAGYKEIFYDWMGANKWLFTKINDLHGSAYDSLMTLISTLGDRHNFPYYLIALAMFVVFSTLIRQLRGKAGTRYYFIGWVGVFAVLIAGFLINTAVIYTAKHYFEYPRPYAALAQDTTYADYQVTVLESGDGPEDDYRSFPSGHAAFITFLIASLWPMLTPGWQKLGVFFILLESWSRIAVGRHFPADAFWAILISLLLVLIVRAVIYAILRKLKINC